jgi:magnesium transporter
VASSGSGFSSRDPTSSRRFATASGSTEVEFGEISIFLGPGFVITVRQGVASELHAARLRLDQHEDLLRAGGDSVLWAILDKVVDHYAPVVEGLERDIEEVERTVFSGAAAPTERIYFLRREVTDFYRAVHPLLAPVDALQRGAFGAVSDELVPYFRDVARSPATRRRGSGRTTTVLEANMAVITVDQGRIAVSPQETLKQLTLIATVFLPLVVVTGFFGQNFGWLVEHIDSLAAFVALGIGGIVLPTSLLYLWFRRSGHLAARRTQ